MIQHVGTQAVHGQLLPAHRPVVSFVRWRQSQKYVVKPASRGEERRYSAHRPAVSRVLLLPFLGELLPCCGPYVNQSALSQQMTLSMLSNIRILEECTGLFSVAENASPGKLGLLHIRSSAVTQVYIFTWHIKVIITISLLCYRACTTIRQAQACQRASRWFGT